MRTKLAKLALMYFKLQAYGLILLTGLTGLAQAGEIKATVRSADVVARTLELEDGRVVAVSPGDAAIGYEGRAIRGVLVEDVEPPRLDFIWPDDPVQNQMVEGINRLLRNDTVTRGRRAYRGVGDYLPPFALYDQNGDVVTNRALQGRNLVLNFIFTRCMEATMCPAATARMVRLQREAREAGLNRVTLVTVSFDPEYDTPGVLRFYGQQRGMDFANYTLLTGDSEAVADLIRQLGILVVPENDTLNHTMATLLINEQGRITHRQEGSRWSTQDFLSRLKRLEGVE